MSQPFAFDNPQAPPNQGRAYVLSTVASGQVSLNEDEQALYVDDGTDDRAIWTDYRITNYYEYDGQKYLMGMTSPAGFLRRKAAVVQLGEPTLLLISEWTACRWWEKPDVPDPTSQDPNWELMDALPVAEMQIVGGADGNTPLWRLSGVYVYACLFPDPLIMRNVVFPKAPWLEDAYQRGVPDNKLKQNLNNVNGSFTAGTSPGGVLNGVSLQGFITRGR